MSVLGSSEVLKAAAPWCSSLLPAQAVLLCLSGIARGHSAPSNQTPSEVVWAWTLRASGPGNWELEESGVNGG